MKHALTIYPFQSVGEFIFNEKRESLLSKIIFKLKSTTEEKLGNNQFVIDNYDEVLAYYNKENNKLFYLTFVPLNTIELIFREQSLFKKTSDELFEFLKQLDNEIVIEEYVGFGSKKYGIDVYSPNYTENKDAAIEGISVAIKGYFDSIYEGKKLNINELQMDDDLGGSTKGKWSLLD